MTEAQTSSLADTVEQLLKQRKIDSAFGIYLTLLWRDRPDFLEDDATRKQRYADLGHAVTQVLDGLVQSKKAQRLYAEGAVPSDHSMVMTYYLYAAEFDFSRKLETAA